MKRDGDENLPVRRLSDEEFAVRDFAVDLLFECGFSRYFCAFGEYPGFDGVRNTRHGCTVVDRRAARAGEGFPAIIGERSK